MAERALATTESAGMATIIGLWIGASMDWLNDNHLAVISLVAIVTGIVTIIAARYRYLLNKRKVDLYEKEIHEKSRRGG